jgi:hypothetical protein
MFVITLSNMFVTTTGLGGPHATWLTWDTLEDAIKAAIELNAQHGLYAYIHPADRTDLTVEMIDTHSFGYVN